MGARAQACRERSRAAGRACVSVRGPVRCEAQAVQAVLWQQGRSKSVASLAAAVPLKGLACAMRELSTQQANQVSSGAASQSSMGPWVLCEEAGNVGLTAPSTGCLAQRLWLRPAPFRGPGQHLWPVNFVCLSKTFCPDTLLLGSSPGAEPDVQPVRPWSWFATPCSGACTWSTAFVVPPAHSLPCMSALRPSGLAAVKIWGCHLDCRAVGSCQISVLGHTGH